MLFRSLGDFLTEPVQQEKMSDLMEGLEFVRTYLDDLLIISNSTFKEHLQQLVVVLKRLRRAGLKINAEKSFFFAPEIEYLSYIRLAKTEGATKRYGLFPRNGRLKIATKIFNGPKIYF